jgi:hypothetical protein
LWGFQETGVVRSEEAKGLTLGRKMMMMMMMIIIIIIIK